MEQKKIVIAGAGIMGASLAQVYGQGGWQTVVYNRSESGLERCRKTMEQNWDDLIAEGLATEANKAAAMALNVPLIPRMMTEAAHSTTGIDIHPGATVGSHFFIDHGTGIVIGQTTIIGAYVKLYQGVTLGGLSTRGGQSLAGAKRHPTIEDDVTIYAGATILGGETVIGKGCVIGANAFVTRSIPANTTVIMKSPELLLRSREEL